MNIVIVTPAPAGSRTGNRVTARRWAGILRSLRQRVQVVTSFAGQRADLLIALHALKSSDSIRSFQQQRPDAPLLVALTGTDLYRDLRRSRRAWDVPRPADRLLVLQPHALEFIPDEFHSRTRIIYQSAAAPPTIPPPLKSCFEVTIVGHLRYEKDPFRAALAARRLPADSKARIVQLGEALNPKMKNVAVDEMHRNDRYIWLGNVPHWRARRLIARSRLLVNSSRMEGGASVISEAIVSGTPVVASRISGHIGLLGADYPGLFECGKTEKLRTLISRAETDAEFYRTLKGRCWSLRKRFSPVQERKEWRRLLAEFR